MKAKLLSAGALIALGCWARMAVAEGATQQASSPGTSTLPEGSAASSVQQETPLEGEEDVLVPTNVSLGGYGGPEMRLTSLLSEPALLVGGQASWVAKHQYLFGVAAYALATRVDAPDTMRIEGNPSTIGLVYGGVRLGVVATPHRLLHVTIAALAGPASLSGISTVPTRAEFEVGYERRLGHTETFFVLEPEVAVEANATNFMRVAIGASYRYVTGVEQPGLSSGNLSSPAVSLALKFGVF